MYPVGSMLKYVNRIAAQYWFIDADAIGVCTGVKDGLTTARFGQRNCWGIHDNFVVITHDAYGVPLEARPVFDAGLLVYGYPPAIDTLEANAGWVRLRWAMRGDAMEVRIRPDGKINWHGRRGPYMGRNEGWSQFDPNRRMGNPWYKNMG